MAKTVPQRGDVVTSKRFRFGQFEEYRQVMVVGFSKQGSQDDPGRETDRFLVVHVNGSAPTGTPTGGSYEVTALRMLPGRRLGDAIMFECQAVCHEKISPSEIDKVDHLEFAPAAANAQLLINAADANEAASIAASLLGFVPTAAPSLNGQYWLVPGHSFRSVTHPKVVGQTSLLVG